MSERTFKSRSMHFWGIRPDMKKLMRALVEADFRGILIADHVPRMVGDNRTGWGFSIGYIRALYDMARDEQRKG